LNWTLLRPRPDVILLGDEAGSPEISNELRLRHVPEVARNEFGTPLVADLFAQAQKMARRDVLCYVNSDIILMNDFMDALSSILAWRDRSPFLAVGNRWNIEVREPIDFSRGWEKLVLQAVREDGQAGGPGTLDYFAFTKGLYGHIPPLVVGRPYWDP
jgi:hypothetical protein